MPHLNFFLLTLSIGIKSLKLATLQLHLQKNARQNAAYFWISVGRNLFVIRAVLSVQSFQSPKFLEHFVLKFLKKCIFLKVSYRCSLSKEQLLAESEKRKIMEWKSSLELNFKIHQFPNKIFFNSSFSKIKYFEFMSFVLVFIWITRKKN